MQTIEEEKSVVLNMSGRGNSGGQRSSLSDQTAVKVKPVGKHTCHRCRNDCVKEYMTCNVCEYVFHAKCEGVSAQQFSLFRELDKLKTHYEWLCSTCRKVDIMNILKSVHAMQDIIEKLELEVESLKQANSAHSVVSSSAELGVGSRQNSVLSEAVNEALDIERRKMNLIVSGIPVSNEKSDTELLHALLEDPVLDISGTISVCNVQRVGHRDI